MKLFNNLTNIKSKTCPPKKISIDSLKIKKSLNPAIAYERYDGKLSEVMKIFPPASTNGKTTIKELHKSKNNSAFPHSRG